ncbi:MAG: DUF3806 domain-containing protein [Pseudohaliea sp.]
MLLLNRFLARLVRARPTLGGLSPVLALCALLCPLGAAPAVAQGAGQGAGMEARIGELTDLDRRYLAQQREDLEDLARSELGAFFTGDPANDIALMQRLLDEGLVTADDRRRLQAMGVVLGDLLAQALDMHWVIYEDQVGRSRALRYRQSDNYLFPATMVSRRREAGDLTPVQEIYDKAVGIIRPLQDPLPFQ